MLQNNPGNVKQNPSNPWRGSIGMDQRGHAIFEREADGWRALFRTLAAKWLAGKKSIIAIMRSWAPASDTVGSIPGNPRNDPERYARFIAQQTGLPFDTPLVFFDLDGMVNDYNGVISIAKAIARYEKGPSFRMSESAMLEGLAAYTRDWPEAKRR